VNKNALKIREITVSAVMLAIALVMRTASVSLPIAGAPVMRVSFSGPFAMFPALAFGPVYGGIVFGLVDVLGFLIRPQGPYIPWLTVVAVIQGFMAGLMWKFVVKSGEKSIFRALICVFAATALYGIINLGVTHGMPGSIYTRWLSGIGKKTIYASIGLIIIGAFGLVMLVIGRFTPVLFNKLFFAAGIPALLATTVNTLILRAAFQLPDKSFLLLWIPRITESIVIMFYNVYVLMILVKIYEMAKTKVKIFS